MTTLTTLSTQWTTDGGRGLRRWSLRVIWLLSLWAMLAGAVFAQPVRSPDDPAVTVREVSGVYIVSASFRVPASPAAVLRVLTDYEAIPRIVPDVLKSVVHARQDTTAIVEQEAVSRVLFFAKKVHLRLHVLESADGIAFRDVCGKSFAVYEGRWHVTGDATGSAVTYQLRAQPSFDVPEFLVKRLLKRDAGQMIARLRQAMVS